MLHPSCPVLRTWVLVLRHQCPVSRPTFPALPQLFSCRKKRSSRSKHFRRETEMRGPDAEHDDPESRQRVPAARTRFFPSQKEKLLLR